jgi:hypothetical protein
MKPTRKVSWLLLCIQGLASNWTDRLAACRVTQAGSQYSWRRSHELARLHLSVPVIFYRRLKCISTSITCTESRLLVQRSKPMKHRGVLRSFLTYAHPMSESRLFTRLRKIMTPVWRSLSPTMRPLQNASPITMQFTITWTRAFFSCILYRLGAAIPWLQHQQ